MKNKILIRLTSLLVALSLFVACEDTAMEKAQDAYDASMVVPAVLSTAGPSLVLQTFSYDYSVGYYRAGSTWNWSAVDATVESVTSDTRGAKIRFNTLPASGKAQIKVTETTVGGTTSPEKIIEVQVNPFCPLPISGFVGSYTGTDGQADETYPAAVTATLEGDKIVLDGLNDGFMAGFWAEEIVVGGTCLVTINPDGTVVVPEQYFCDTDYSAGYKIKGSGTWDNCGAKPTLKINYDVWYPDGNYWIAVKYAANYFGGKAYLTANLTME